MNMELIEHNTSLSSYYDIRTLRIEYNICIYSFFFVKIAKKRKFNLIETYIRHGPLSSVILLLFLENLYLFSCRDRYKRSSMPAIFFLVTTMERVSDISMTLDNCNNKNSKYKTKRLYNFGNC